VLFAKAQLITIMSVPNADIESPLQMRELEPSPIEETPKDTGGDSYFPPTQTQPKRSTTFMGLGDHSPAYYRMSFTAILRGGHNEANVHAFC
jgi:hypothetical protein